MLSALHSFGLAIGSMDIAGAVFFELIIILMLCRKYGNQAAKNANAQISTTLEQGHLNTIYNNKSKPHLLWTYIILLNVWIVVSLLMIIGILMNKPQLILFWLFWCFCGLVFDLFYVFWWIVEMFSGDAIEALTNILISLLTMAIELGFVYVIYSIYMNLKLQPTKRLNDMKRLFGLPYLFL